MKPPVIIMLCGKKGSGKTSLAKGIVNWADNTPFRIHSFADPIKTAFRNAFPQVEPWHLLDRTEKEKHRPFFQKYGDACRAVTEDYFGQAMISSIMDYETTHWMGSSPERMFIIIDDLRYFNEYKSVANAFPGRVVVAQISSSNEVLADTHSSESMEGLDSISDIQFHNPQNDIPKDSLALYNKLLPLIQKLTEE
jgi:hypothetical protein